MLRVDNWKLCYGHGEPPELELYDLQADPGEFHNLAGDERFRHIEDSLMGRLFEIWDPEEVRREVIASQEARVIISQVVGRGGPTGGELSGWAFDPNISEHGSNWVR